MTEFGATTWGRAWLRLAEPVGVTGIDTRLPRARSMARRGEVLRLVVTPGRVTAAVLARGREHPVELRIPVWAEEQRGEVDRYLRDHPVAATALDGGDAPDELAAGLLDGGVDAAPHPETLGIECPCRESRRPCVHVLATYYAVVQRIDEEPALALAVRGFARSPAEPEQADGGSIPIDALDPNDFFAARTSPARG